MPSGIGCRRHSRGIPSGWDQQRRVPRTATPMAQTVRPLRIIAWRELSSMIPYTRQHVLRLEKAGKFPRRIQLGPRRVGWLYTEIEAWIAALAEGRKPYAPAE